MLQVKPPYGRPSPNSIQRRRTSTSWDERRTPSSNSPLFPPLLLTVNKSLWRWQHPVSDDTRNGRTSNLLTLPGLFIRRQTPPPTAQPCKLRSRTRKRPLWPRSCSKCLSHLLASRGGANHGQFPPLQDSVRCASSGATLPTSAAPGPLSATHVQAHTSPPSTGLTSLRVKTTTALIIKYGVQTAMTYTRLLAPCVPSSKHARPLASFKSCRKRELNDSAAIYDGSQHPDQHATIQ